MPPQQPLFMKRFLVVLMAFLLCAGVVDAQAQNRSGRGKTTKSKTTTSKKKKGKKDKKDVEVPVEAGIDLPYNSNDALFAIELQPDVPFGPTKGPVGGGRVMEIMSDKAHPDLFEYEHNSVWYKFKVPYNGLLEIEITPTNAGDDYDFLLYKYTDNYFSNHILQNKVLPVAVNMALPDTAGVKPQTVMVNGKAVTRRTATAPSIGMKYDATDKMLTKQQTGRFIKSIPVAKDDIYYLALDNVTRGGGHTVKVSVHVDAFEPLIVFYDPIARKSVDVELLILERNTQNREIVKNPRFKNGRVKFVPKFNYTLYAKKPGYFSIYKDFNSDIFMTDTMMRFVMNRTEKGTVFPIDDIYFVDGESQLLPESDTVLLNYIAMFRNHPDVTFLIKGYVTTYGVDVEHDQQMSLARAQSVKDFFSKNGIEAERIEVVGMTPNEIKRAANDLIDKKKSSSKKTKVELIITGIKK